MIVGIYNHPLYLAITTSMLAAAVVTSAFVLVANLFELSGMQGRAAKLLLLLPLLTLAGSLHSGILRVILVCSPAVRDTIRLVYRVSDMVMVFLLLAMSLLQVLIYTTHGSKKKATPKSKRAP
jgi:hypothetical protein